ncbi:MAG: bifunctional DNA-formamidopyrimidine glycosylase/DNA-(apurinic or apyrimidinic site) lyase [Halanaerobiaceae bacterium]
MPELPEVETIVSGLSLLIKGSTIEDIIIREKNLIAFPSVEEFKDGLKNKSIIAITRRGKYILIRIEGHKTLVVHLRMTGRLLVKSREVEYDKHTHIIFQLNNELDLRFHNVRKFGRMYLVDSGDYTPAGGLANLGPEPLSEKFTLEVFRESISRRSTNIKSLLLNQSFLAGLGNIYTDEALFMAKILPERKADTLTDGEIENLYNAIRYVLKQGVKLGGTSFSDYLNAFGEKGKFQYELKVYQQEGSECTICGSKIIKKRIAGRGTHYCPVCQK